MNHLGISGQLSEVASQLATDVEVLIRDANRGPAGDRGLLYSKLVVSATRDTKASLDGERPTLISQSTQPARRVSCIEPDLPCRSPVYLLEELRRVLSVGTTEMATSAGSPQNI